MSTKHNIKFDHRARITTARGGKLADPDQSYGRWAYWYADDKMWHAKPRCPACRTSREFFTGKVGRGNAYSRYSDNYICSACGVTEASLGFFWRASCDPKTIKEHHRA